MLYIKRFHMINKKILLFGGSGSLGNAFIQRYLETNPRKEIRDKVWQVNVKPY